MKIQMKHRKPQIIIPFTLPFDWSADFQRQTCLELAKRGFSVTAYMNDDAHFFLKKSNVQYPKIKNITFFIPKYYIPLRRNPLIEKLNQRLALSIFSFSKLLQKKVIWVFDPQFYYFSQYFSNKTSLYDCVDFFGELHKEDEDKLIARSDYFFVNSKTLQAAHQHKKNQINLVPQGFNTTEFQKYIHKLDKKTKKTKPIVGYVGGINERIQYPLLHKLIKKNPQWTFSFWGPVQQYLEKNKTSFIDDLNKIQKLPNVLFNQTKNKLELMNAINNFDICLIPYNIQQEFNLNCYPMKVFEYFYLGKPVVSTPITELCDNKFKNLILIANTSEEFEKHISFVLKTKWKHQSKQKELANDNSWENKVSMILKKLSLTDIMR